MPCWPSRCCTSGVDYRDPQFQILNSLYQAKVTLRIMLHYWIYEIIPSYNDYPDIASSSPCNHAGARYFSEASGVSVAEGTDQLTRRGRSRDQVRLGKPRQPIAPPNLPAVRPQPCARLELTSGCQKLHLAAGGAGKLSGYSFTILPAPRSHVPLVLSSPSMVRRSLGPGWGLFFACA